MLRAGAVFVIYLVLAVWYTDPLLPLRHSHIAGEPPGDPLLNASVLQWNATNVPLTNAWWNAPHFYPGPGTTTFTENLLGISPIATPIYWLTGNPLTTYNVALFLSWPLSAFAGYLLVLYLTRRQDAAFIAGLAYGFSTYRTAELGHIQVVSSYWMPLALLGLHGFVKDRRVRWLALFGASWLLQSLANLYFMLYGAVLIALWLVYFCTRRSAGRLAWRPLVSAVVAWAIASLPLIPILLTYRRVHAQYGLERALAEPIGFSYTLKAWFATSAIVRFWGRIFPDDADNLFPGLTIVVLVAAGAIAALLRRRPDLPPIKGRRAALIAALWIIWAASMAVIVVTMFIGGWQVAIGPLTIRVHDLYRAALVASICGVALILLTRRMRDAWNRRSTLLFYGIAAIAMAVFALGPVVSARGQVLFEPAPYGLLLALPGFDAVRIPSRFWMFGVLCLATAGGLVFSVLTAGSVSRRRLLFGVVAAGLMLDAWMWGMNMVPGPLELKTVERPDRPEAIVELPIGESTLDAHATFRAMGHRRRVANGVSGYDPPHYLPLVEGLTRKDPDMLQALASLGAIDAVIDGSHDGDGAWAAYLKASPGVTHVASDGSRAAYRIPAAPLQEIRLGDTLPIASTSAIGGHPARAIDGRIDDALDTRWDDGPQHPKQWFIADLGDVREVAGVTEWLGELARDFPRHLAIDVSLDGATWETVWEGRTAAMAFLAAVRSPRETPLRFEFAPRPARFVRLRQLGESTFLWAIAELHVHAPRLR